MRILHRTLLRKLPAPFFAALGSLMFILLMQFLMRYMRDLIGKGLAFSIIVDIIAYNLCYMVVLAVPMSVLIATLIVFGRLSETGYYRVVKASGISLPQLVWPVWIITFSLVAFMMYFNNQVLPEANYRAKALWYDIRASRPAFVLEPGVFYEGVDGYSIRATSIDPLANRLEGITVFDHSEDRTGRVTVSARAGRLETYDRGLRIDLILEDGQLHRYDDNEDKETYELLKFREYKIPLDLTNAAFERSDITATTRSDRTTASSVMAKLVREHEADIASKKERAAERLKSYPDYGRSDDQKTFLGDEPIGGRDPSRNEANLTPSDSVEGQTHRLAVLELATPHIRELRGEVQELASSTVWVQRRANRFRVEIHKKFSIAFACFVFVLIGIPLGLRVRRGGLGVVSILSLVIFLVYWVSLVQGEKLADRGFLDPWIGMWAANIIVGVVAIALFTIVASDVRHRGVSGKGH